MGAGEVHPPVKCWTPRPWRASPTTPPQVRRTAANNDAGSVPPNGTPGTPIGAQARQRPPSESAVPGCGGSLEPKRVWCGSRLCRGHEAAWWSSAKPTGILKLGFVAQTCAGSTNSCKTPSLERPLQAKTASDPCSQNPRTPSPHASPEHRHNTTRTLKKLRPERHTPAPTKISRDPRCKRVPDGRIADVRRRRERVVLSPR